MHKKVNKQVSAKENRIIKLRDALHTASGTDCTYEQLSRLSGYKVATIRTYVSKNMLLPYVKPVSVDICRVEPNLSLSLATLRRLLSQRADRYSWEHLGVTELVSSLLDRSKTNAGLALELINRPELANRLDAFVLLLSTAWEQLLKAAVERKSKGGIFTGQRSQTNRPLTITFARALDTHIPNSKDPVRKNIEKLKELRDDAAHLLVPEVTAIATRYFQASILNYIKEFQDIAGESPFKFEGTGLLTLGVAYQSPTIDVLRGCHGSSADEVHALISDLEKEAAENDDSRFAVSIKYELILEKNETSGAIKLVNGPGGVPVRAVKVPKDPKTVCPHSATDVATILTTRTGVSWSANDVGIVAEYMKVKSSNNEFHY